MRRPCELVRRKLGARWTRPGASPAGGDPAVLRPREGRRRRYGRGETAARLREGDWSLVWGKSSAAGGIYNPGGATDRGGGGGGWRQRR